MVINSSKIKDNRLAALTEIAQSELGFYPCGSRYFGYAREDSDFDFFAPAAPSYRDFCTRSQFVRRPREIEQYFDVNTVEIWKRDNVTVILVRHPEARVKLQEHIRDNNIRPPKEDTDWWNALYRKLCPDIFPAEPK